MDKIWRKWSTQKNPGLMSYTSLTGEMKGTIRESREISYNRTIQYKFKAHSYLWPVLVCAGPCTTGHVVSFRIRCSNVDNGTAYKDLLKNMHYKDKFVFLVRTRIRTGGNRCTLLGTYKDLIPTMILVPLLILVGYWTESRRFFLILRSRVRIPIETIFFSFL